MSLARFFAAALIALVMVLRWPWCNRFVRSKWL